MQGSISSRFNIYSIADNGKHHNIENASRLNPKLLKLKNLKPKDKNGKNILKQHNANKNINNNIKCSLFFF